jgi:hypothetical protein
VLAFWVWTSFTPIRVGPFAITANPGFRQSIHLKGGKLLEPTYEIGWFMVEFKSITTEGAVSTRYMATTTRIVNVDVVGNLALAAFICHTHLERLWQ